MKNQKKNLFLFGRGGPLVFWSLIAYRHLVPVDNKDFQ